MFTMRRVVRIFSREGDSFSFLSDALQAEDSIREVRSFAITNTGHSKFREEVSRCDFAILYHSKNRGRLNMTDVTDSLYNEEIRYLSTKLGRENVIVVADDLDDSSSEIKMGILQGQPLIQEMAADLFLISKEDKNSPELLNEKLQKITSCILKKGSSLSPLSAGSPSTAEIVIPGCMSLHVSEAKETSSVPASNTSGNHRSLPTAVDFVQLLYKVPGQMFLMVMSGVLLFSNTVIVWVMTPVRGILIIYHQWIHIITTPVRGILFIYHQWIHIITMVPRFILTACTTITRTSRTPRKT